MKRLAIIAVFAVFLFGNVSCEKSSESYIDYEEILNAGDRRSKDDNPYKSLELSTKSADFLKKGNAFTFELIDRINKGSKEDFIISPLSVQFLLGMVLDGAQFTPQNGKPRIVPLIDFEDIGKNIFHVVTQNLLIKILPNLSTIGT